MLKIPKHIYIHWFLMIAIFTVLITAILTYILITAPIEHNQRVITEAVNYLLNECNFVQGSESYNMIQNISMNWTK